jgi:nucleolar protein TMA23
MSSTTANPSRLDAHALLTSQGWRGTGHSLHPTSDATGLRHHLLIKREGTDGRGLGSGKAQQKADAWWLNAFDQALKGLDTGGIAGAGLRQTVPGARLDLERITARGAAKYTGCRGLYTCFVRGGLLTPPDSGAGTPEAASETCSSGEEKKRRKEKKKAAAEKEEDEEETKEERRARQVEKKQRKEKEAEEKAARKEAERKAAAKAEKKAQKKVQKKAAKEALKTGETKEERRARREARRARKDEKRQKRKDSEG